MSVQVQLIRDDYLAGEPEADLGALRPAVAEAWAHATGAGYHPGAPAVFVGHEAAGTPATVAAEDVLGRFVRELPDADAQAGGISGLLVDDAGVVRVRIDSDAGLGALLDRRGLTPGFSLSEATVGPTAASLCRRAHAAAWLVGSEHLNDAFDRLACAAAPVSGGTIMLVAVGSTVTTELRTLTAALAHLVERSVQEAPFRGRAAVTDAFTTTAATQRWTLATDGDMVASSRGVRELEPADVRALTDAAQAALVLHDDDTHHRMDLPSGASVEVTVAPVFSRGEIVGTTLVAQAMSAALELVDAGPRRRQGAHVPPVARRDFASDFRAQRAARGDGGAGTPAHLVTPAVRARAEATTFTQEGHNYVLLGEPGTGKRTLAVEQFRAVHPDGHVTVLDCQEVNDRTVLPRAEPGRPTLVVVRGLHHLTPIAARKLDERIGLDAAGVLLAATLDANAVDPSRPYGLVLRHFHGTTRVPPLRARVDELGGIAVALLRRRAGGRSLRLSPQAVRVMEGYGWPGNINELEDVLQYAARRKQLGEIQPPDLPPVCFQGRARKLSMLEAAQCDAIIQALYESGGNRHRAAQLLGIARSSLYRKIEAFGISYVA